MSDEEYFADVEDDEGFWLLDKGWEYADGTFGDGEATI